MSSQKQLQPLADRGPLRVMFTICRMPVGGAETLLVELIRGLDRDRFAPELCCLKDLGPLGELLTGEIPTHCRLWANKYDPTILSRLTSLYRERRIDAVVTVGAGDKMFWGRLAAWRAGIPVVVSALHSTGWPDRVERMNRWLTKITDAFVGVAEPHGRHLVEDEGFPAEKVRVIPNGVDVQRFRPSVASRSRRREQWGIPQSAPLAGIVAALRPEKNIEAFLLAAAKVRMQLPEARFVVIGDGPERETLQETADALQLGDALQFLGVRKDIPQILSTLDLFALTSESEANPVSILEAMSCGLPVVATDVGSISSVVKHDVSGFVVPSGDVDAMADYWLRLLSNRDRAHQFGRVGRELAVSQWSLGGMVHGYEDLLTELYMSKVDAPQRSAPSPIVDLPAADVEQRAVV